MQNEYAAVVKQEDDWWVEGTPVQPASSHASCRASAGCGTTATNRLDDGAEHITHIGVRPRATARQRQYARHMAGINRGLTRVLRSPRELIRNPTDFSPPSRSRWAPYAYRSSSSSRCYDPTAPGWCGCRSLPATGAPSVSIDVR